MSPINPASDEKLKSRFPRPIAATYFALAQVGETVEVARHRNPAGYGFDGNSAGARHSRACCIRPCCARVAAIGVIVCHPQEPGSVFSDKHIELVRTFADQAVIAIENVRLFDEVQAKTRDLTEALTYQTGSANILSVIASSPTDVGPVLKAIVESACELCEAYDAIMLSEGWQRAALRAHHGPIPIDLEKHGRSIGTGLLDALVRRQARQCMCTTSFPPKAPNFPIGQETVAPPWPSHAF